MSNSAARTALRRRRAAAAAVREPFAVMRTICGSADYHAAIAMSRKSRSPGGISPLRVPSRWASVKAPMSAMLAVSRGAASAIAGSSLPGSAWKS